MRMNILLLSDALSDHFHVMKTISRHRKLTLGHVRLYKKETLFHSNTVYLAKGALLPPSILLPSETAFICIGPAPDLYKTGNCDYVELDSSSDISEVLDCIQSTYDLYDAWYCDIQEILLKEENITAVFSRSLPLVVNPICCHNQTYDVLAYAENADLLDQPNIYSSAQNRLDFANKLEVNKEYQHVFQSRDAALWHDDSLPFDCLYCNIFYNNNYWGRITFDIRCRPVHNSDYVLIEILRDLVENALSKWGLLPIGKKDSFENMLTALLNGESIGEDDIRTKINQVGWSAYSHYFCALVRMEEKDIITNYLPTFCNAVKLNLDCQAVPFQNDAVILVPAEIWNRRGNFLSTLTPLLKKNQLKAIISNEFTDLRDLHDYYEQVNVLLPIALQSKRKEWIFFSEDYMLDYMLKACTGDLSPNRLTHPGLLILAENDRKNNLSYVETLKAYVNNNCSQAAACRALYLHRSTLLQRLARIKKLTNFDLENQRTVLYLRMYFAMTDNYQSQ